MMKHVLSAIQDFVEHSTIELVERVAASLEQCSTWEDVRRLPKLPSAKLNLLWISVIQASSIAPQPPSATAFALRATAAIEERHRETPRMELVFSGLQLPPYDMRRTDEALLEIIHNARERLTIVSFVMYRIERFSEALAKAAQRGTAIRLFVEGETLPKQDQGLIFGDWLALGVDVFVWSDDRRQSFSNGRQGVLHAKATVADGATLLISSANITEHAMSLNIELGVLIRDRDYARKIELLFDNYVSLGIFKRVSTAC